MKEKGTIFDVSVLSIFLILYVFVGFAFNKFFTLHY